HDVPRARGRAFARLSRYGAHVEAQRGGPRDGRPLQDVVLVCQGGDPRTPVLLAIAPLGHADEQRFEDVATLDDGRAGRETMTHEPARQGHLHGDVPGTGAERLLRTRRGSRKNCSTFIATSPTGSARPR